MFLTILSLLFLLLVARGFARVIRYFWGWLGYDSDLDRAVASGYLSDETRRAARLGGPRLGGAWPGRRGLTPEQRREIARARDQLVEETLDNLRFGWYQAVFIFVAGSVVGLLIEEVWMLVTAGVTQSRVGLVWGPFSPIYGFGAVALTMIAFYLRRRGAGNVEVFLVSAVVGGALEQLTGWAMVALFDAQSWTYLGLPDHITQWVAWRFLAMWGLLGVVWARRVMPWLLTRIGEPTTRRQVVFVIILAVYLTFDIVMTLACFGRRARRDAGYPASGAFEQWVDENYTDQFMSDKFQNLVIGQDL